MIKNNIQYIALKKEVDGFDAYFKDYDKRLESQNLHPIQKKLYLDTALIRHKENITKIEEYEAIKNKEITELKITNCDDFPKLLIQSRIANGWSHKDLAEKLMTQEQQVQRFEQNDYLTTSFERVLQTMRALGIEIEATKRICQTKIVAFEDYDFEKISKMKARKSITQFALAQ